MTQRTTPIRAAALAAAATISLLAAGPAHADSISYIKDGDVWVSSPDGSQAVQVTHDGGYGYASRADDGSFIALHGRNLRRISPTGQVTADFSTPVSGEQTAPKTSFFRGPYKPEISPDGTKVAYEYWYQEYYTDPGCAPIGSPNCTDSRVWTGIGYSHSDRMTGWDEPGLGRQSGWIDPSWIDNDTLLQSDKSVRPNVDTIIDHPGDGNQTIQEWFQDDNAWYLRDGELSRRGDAGAWISAKPRDASDPDIGQEDDQVTIYKLNGAPPALPEQCFSFFNASMVYASPTFSPDGAHVAFTAKNRKTNEISLVIADIPDQSHGCRLPTSGGKVLTTGVVGPDWSPAPVPAIPQGGGGANGGGGAGVPTGSGNGGTAKPGSGPTGTPTSTAVPAPDANGIAVSAGKGALRKAAGGRLPLTVQLPGAGRVKLTVSVKGKPVGTVSTRASAASSVGVTIRLGARARRAFAGRQVTATVQYRFTPQSGAAVKGTATLALSR